MNDALPNSDDPMLRINEVERQTGLKKSTIYDMVKKGEFPSPVRLGRRASGWPASDVRQWKQARIAASRADAGIE